ncbi:MAG: putative DNA binding domain-containing protein [Erysipelotrichaceae bacterium]|nr:putative DNA binding domain-containing protein [Erysipelotrichaceae bacterium]
MYKENYKEELKRQMIDEIKKEIVAFLNSEGGIIYVGVNDNGTINDDFLNEDQDLIQLKLEGWIQDAFYPLPSNLIRGNFKKDGVYAIEVKEGNKKPYYLREKGPKPSGVYKRVGASIRKCNDDEILAMIMDSNHYDFESDVSENQDLTFKYFNRICSENNIVLSKKQMTIMGIINSNGAYTNIGLLMSDQSPIEVKFAVYDNKMNFKIKKTFNGSLLKIIEDVQDTAERMNDTSAVIDTNNWQRTETKSYPGKSLREIILNAFCHSNYFIRSNIKIEFFEDKVKVTSPGGLFKSSIEDMLKGVQTYRNLKLVHILDKMKYIENFGTGIPRTLEAYENSDRQPEFYNSENFYRLLTKFKL